MTENLRRSLDLSIETKGYKRGLIACLDALVDLKTGDPNATAEFDRGVAAAIAVVRALVAR
jgi:hypothetical protein